MSRRSSYLALALFCLLAPAAAQAIETTSVARRVAPSMVRIVVEGEGRQVGGSGFVVSTEGHIATAYHVIRPHVEAEWQVFVLQSGAADETRRSATLVGAFPEEDLAVLKVEGLDQPPAVLSEAGGDSLPQGMEVFAVGFPGAGGRLGGETETSFTAGLVNRLFVGAWTADSARIRIIQHSAATNPGNSGGPVINPCGQVVGVNTEREMAMVITPAGLPFIYDVIQGVFFASHISVLTEKLKSLDVPYNGSTRTCRIIFGVASTNYPWYAAGAVALLIVLAVVLIRQWPRRVVHIVVVGGHTARNRARALGHLIFRPRSWGEPQKVTWRLRCDDAAGGGPIDIVIDEDDLRRAPQGLVIGSDAACDHSLAAGGIDHRHAELVSLGDTLGVRDLHSRTGTAVDARSVDPDDGPAPLHPGAELRLGNLVFRVERR